jgi:protein gp37
MEFIMSSISEIYTQYIECTPAFGYFTLYNREEYLKSVLEDGLRSSNVYSAAMNMATVTDLDNIAKSDRQMKRTACIPLLGQIMGIARIIFAMESNKLGSKDRAFHVIRGSLEFLNLGPILLIADLIIAAVGNRSAINLRSGKIEMY